MELFHSQDETRRPLQAALRDVARSEVYAAEKQDRGHIYIYIYIYIYIKKIESNSRLI